MFIGGIKLRTDKVMTRPVFIESTVVYWTLLGYFIGRKTFYEIICTPMGVRENEETGHKIIITMTSICHLASPTPCPPIE